MCDCEHTYKAQKMKSVEFANSVDPDEAAHNELPHLGLHCLQSQQFWFYNICPLVYEFWVWYSLDKILFQIL